MNGLPSNVDLSAIIGREISMIRIGKFQLHYFLSEDSPNRPNVRIEIEGSDVTLVDPKN
jgi:hypothetical protein